MTPNASQAQQLSCGHKSAWSRREQSGLWDGFGASLGENKPSPRHSLKVSIPIPRVHRKNILQLLGPGMVLGCTIQKRRWGGDAPLHHHAPSMADRFHAGELFNKIDPSYPCPVPSYHRAKPASIVSTPSVPVARDASSFTAC